MSNHTKSQHIDLLDEDKPISGQKFVCVSFVSPENIIREKQQYFFDEFTKQWGLTKSLEKFTEFLSFLSYKYELSHETLQIDLENFCKEEQEKLFQNSLTVYDEYKTYIDNNEERLQQNFDKQHQFQTSTRGLKIRGSFPSQEEAELRAKIIREMDPHHDVYVGPVGMWMPFNPDAYKTGRVEYLENELNQLMHEKNKNEEEATKEFDARVKEAKRKAIEDNIENAEKSGNKLTQTLDESGNLVNVDNSTAFNGLLNNPTENESVSSIEKTLFESGNIPVSGKERVYKDYS
tara:strand:+ start:348 stop:1220 length:873 start_codon:yes stop_codon:yes gene_type:complete